MRKTVLLCVLLIFCAALVAELAWEQPKTLVNFENIEYRGESLQTSDGCHLLLWWQNDNAIPGYKLGFYDQQYQPLWDAPLAIPTSSNVYKMVETADQAFALVYPNSAIKVLKISRTGEFLWGSQGITVLPSLWTDTTASLAADHSGGVFVSWSGDGYDGQRCAIQHLDASGALTMPSTGVIMDTTIDCWYNDLLVLQDDSVLITWTVLYTVKMQRLNQSGLFIWSQPVNVASSDNYPTGKFCAFADASFAFCVDHYNYVDVQRYNYSGIALWTQPVTAISASGIYGYSMHAVPGPDNTVFITAETNNTEYLQKISADGVLHYGTGIDLTTGIGYLDGITQALPDADGGCTVVACGYANPRDVKAIQVSATGVVTVHEVTNTAFRKENPSAHRYGNTINIEWHEQETWRRGIKVQMLDQQFQPQLAANGAELVYGSSGMVREAMAAARSNGSAVIWQQAVLSSTHWDLYLQIYTSTGVPLYGPGGIKINRPGSSLSSIALVHCNENHTMVVWGEDLSGVISKRYQIFDAAGNILLPEGGLPVGTSAQSVGCINVSTYLGDWYLIWTSANAIWGQRIRGTTPLWGDGIQITQPHPDITAGMMNIKLEWPWLTWSLGSKPMLARIDANGLVQPGFPAWGMGLPVQDGSYEIFKHTFTVCGDNLHALLGFVDYYVPDPYYVDKYMHTLIGPQGDYLFTLADLPVSIKHNVFSRNGTVCVGDYYNNYQVREYDTSGAQTSMHSIPVAGFQNGGWEVLGTKYLSNGDLLLLTRGYLNGSPAIRHIFITPQWQQDLPVDSVVLTGGGYLPPLVSILGDRAWIAMAAGRDIAYNNASTVFLQGVVIAGTPNPDPDPVVPALPLIESCSPNPFNPTTSISFSLPQAGKACISVYDLRGRKIATLLDSEMPAGQHSINWNGKDMDGREAASGVYILRLEATGKRHTRKVTLMK